MAADGGGNIARSMGARPDAVIGDLDSYVKPEEEAPKIIHKPSQYANDLEKALTYAQKLEGTHIRILGATGKRLDHTLKNLSVLKQFAQHFEQILFEDRYGSTLLLSSSFTREFEPGTVLSLFPLSGRVTGITTKGLKYPLEDDFLENGIQDGSSNTVISSPVHITHAKGDLLLFIAK